MPIKRAVQKRKSDNVFGQARKRAKIVRAGLYARVSTTDQQTLAMQNRAMREMSHGGAGLSPYRSARSTPGRHDVKLARNYSRRPAAARSTWCWCGAWIAGADP